MKKNKKLAGKDILANDMGYRYSLKQDVNDFLRFIKSNIGLVLTNIFFVLLAYGIKLFHYSISIDTEALLYNQDELLNSWIGIGRYGLLLLKYILGTTIFVPYTATFLMICTLLLLLVLLCFCFNYFHISGDVVEEKIKETNKIKFGLIIFSAVFISCPILAEQFNFLLQSFEVAVAMVMSVIASFLLTKWSSCKNIFDNSLYLILGILFLTFSITSYQSIMFFFVSVTTSFFIIKYIRDQKSKTYDVKYGLIILKQILAFIISSLIYLVTNKIIQYIFGLKSVYLDNKFLWGKVPISQCLSNIILYCKVVVFGENLFFTKWFLILTLILGIIWLTVLFNNYRQKLMFTIGVLVFVLSPFLLSCYLGNFVDMRAQLSLPFVFAVECMMLVIWSNKCWIKNSLVLLFVMIALRQGFIVNKLFYGEYMKYKQDVAIGHNIAYKIGLLGLGEVPDKPVVFVGVHHPNFTCVTFKGEVLGHSFWEWDNGNIRRQMCFMNIIGYPYIYPSQEQIEYADDKAKDLPSYPSEGYVKDLGEVIVVKLSD